MKPALNLPTYGQVRPVLKDVVKGVNAICPNPNVTVKLPSTISFGCQ